MNYDPERSHRRSIRLKRYDYSLPGTYFVTLISHGRVCLFGDIEDGKINLNSIGKLVVECWLSIPKNFSNARLDELILMPNHLHGIIIICDSLGKGEAFAEIFKSTVDTNLVNASPLRPIGTQQGSLGAIIQNFKSVSTRMVNQKYFEAGNKIWQRNYFERIIRNDRELNAIRQYIRDNPNNWKLDRENPINI